MNVMSIFAIQFLMSLIVWGTLAYTEDTQSRNHTEFVNGRAEVRLSIQTIYFLIPK